MIEMPEKRIDKPPRVSERTALTLAWMFGMFTAYILITLGFGTIERIVAGAVSIIVMLNLLRWLGRRPI